MKKSSCHYGRFTHLLAMTLTLLVLTGGASVATALPISVSTEIYVDHYAEDANGNSLISTGPILTNNTNDLVSSAPFEVFSQSWTLSSAQYDDVWESMLVDIYTDFSLDAGDLNTYEVSLSYAFSSNASYTGNDSFAETYINGESFSGSQIITLNSGVTESFSWLYELYGDAGIFGGTGEYNVNVAANLNITDIKMITTSVSEPSSLLLMLLGFAGLVSRKRK